MSKDPTDGRDDVAIGLRLALTRQVFGYAQGEFARKAGVSETAYNQWEKGRKRPSIDAANALCDTFNLSLDWIYRGDQSALTYQTATALMSVQAAQSDDAQDKADD